MKTTARRPRSGEFRGAAVAFLALLSAAGARAEGPTEAEIASSTARGIAFLRRAQAADGGWDYHFIGSHRLGMTALAGLALLENGVAPTDPAIARARRLVEEKASESDQTYDVALSILFLAREGSRPKGESDGLIGRLGRRLAAGGPDGLWSYPIPLVVEEPEPPSYPYPSPSPYPEPDQDRPDGPAGSGRQDEEVEANRKGGLPDEVRPKARRRASIEGEFRRPRPPRPARPARVLRDGDHSNTQFALLGVWAAGRNEFDSDESLAAIDDHFRSVQRSDGRWGYRPGEAGTDSMTCAGLMGLAIAAARPGLAERQTARARGAALAADPKFRAALSAVTRDAVRMGPRSDIYYLWSLERVCVALGLRTLGELDWYGRGAGILLARQRDDGSWPHDRWGTLPNTCLALLFLRKANLAFELDRVLRLPGSSVRRASLVQEIVDPPDRGDVPRPATGRGGEAEGAGDDATVVVTGVSQREFPKIAVQFEVRDKDGSFRRDARHEEFRVTEDGRDVPVLDFQAPRSTETIPTTLVLVVDRSLSMQEEDRMGALKRAVDSFLDRVPAGSRVAVVAFGSEVRRISPFTTDYQRVREAVDRLEPGGATRFYDAVAESLAMLDRESGRRAVLALTDGEDTFSQGSDLDSAIASARRLGLPVYTLGLGSEDEIESDDLRRLAGQTRGQYYPARRADELRAIYERIAERIGAGYTLLYQSDRKLPDGTLRPVRIHYERSRRAAETAVFIPGMVVPAGGWPLLFLVLAALLVGLSAAPARWLRQGPASEGH